MDADLRRGLDAVADEPAEAFVQRLERSIAAVLDERPQREAVTEVDVTDSKVSMPGDPRQRHRWPIALAAAAAVAALLAALVVRSRSSIAPVTPPTTVTTPQPTAPTTPPETTVATTVGTSQTTTASSVPLPQTVPSSFWESLPDSPLAPRYGPLVVALGDDVLVVGGRPRAHLDDPLSTLRDGAMLRADGTAWRHVADAPVALGNEDAAVWTGSELVALSADGVVLSYEPGADSWQELGRVSGPLRAYATAVWTGSEMIVGGGVDTSTPRPADQGGWERATGAVAFKPSSKSWRTIPAPGSGVDLAGASVWTGTALVRASAITDSQDPVVASGRLDGAYDPAANHWRSLPNLPGDGAVGVLLADGGALVAFDTASVQWRLDDGAKAWRREGVVPVGGWGQVGAAWTVDGHLVIDTGSGGTNGRFVGYRQSSGAWASVGSPPVSTNDDAIVQTASGQLVGTNGQKAGRLRTFNDQTVGVAPCRNDQLEVTVARWVAGTRIVLTNRSTTACTVDGQRPAIVEVNGVAQTPAAWLSTPSGTDGGYLAPNQQALIDITDWIGPNSDAPCAVSGPIISVRFALGSEAPLDVDVAIDKPCPDLSAVAALPQSAATTADAPCTSDSLLASTRWLGGASSHGATKIVLTNIDTATCRFASQPRLQASVTKGGPWVDVVAPSSDSGYMGFTVTPVVALGPGEFAEIVIQGTNPGPYPDGRCPTTTTNLPVAAGYRLAFDDGTTVDLRGFTLAGYDCGILFSGLGHVPPTT